MKILVIQLLRLGDIVLSTPVVSGLREKYPGSEVHLLINSQFGGIEPLLDGVDRIWKLDRDALQKGLGGHDRGLFESFDRLHNLIQDLKEEKYDLVLNLTHNRLSGWITSLIPCRDSVGLEFSQLGSASFGSSWFRYLNGTENDNNSQFHIADIFQYSAGLENHRKKITLRETPHGQSEARPIRSKLGRYFCIQPFTSDSKKNWELKNWTSVIQQVQQGIPGLIPVLLCSSAERPKLNSLENHLQSLDLKYKIADYSLEGIYSVLLGAEFLVTGDTAIKHMASGADIPVIEISIGSSHFRFTGAYQDRAWILQSREHCAPCQHSELCHRESHACSERISPELVTAFIHAIANQNPLALRTIAHEFSDQAKVYRSNWSSMGWWTTFCFNESFSTTILNQAIDQLSWKLQLQKEWEKHVGDLGHETMKLTRALREEYRGLDKEECLDALEFLARSLERFEGRLEVLHNDWKNIGSDFGSEAFKKFYENLIHLRDEAKSDEQLRSFGTSLNEIPKNLDQDQFIFLRRTVGCLTEVRQRTQISERIIRTMKSNIMEAL